MGKYSKLMAIGTVFERKRKCLNCKEGTYGTILGASSDLSCVFCEAGKYSSNLGWFLQ
jgi:hypothetical protein